MRRSVHCTQHGVVSYVYMDEKKFAEGFFFKRHPSAPEFVIGSLGIKVEDAVRWVQQQKQKENGFINLDIKRSQKGTYYLELNEFEKQL